MRIQGELLKLGISVSRPVGAGNSDSAVLRLGRLRVGRVIGGVSGGEGSFSGHGSVVRVLVAAPAARAGRAPASFGAGERDRDPAAAAPVAGAAASSRSSAADAG